METKQKSLFEEDFISFSPAAVIEQPRLDRTVRDGMEIFNIQDAQKAKIEDGLFLDYCSYRATKYACQGWHYSRTVPKSKLVKIGVWENREFIGAIIFSMGNTDNLGTKYGYSGKETCELARIALTDHKAPVSQIVPKAIKLLKNRCEDLQLVVSYSDQNQGHLGKIYQAMNWLYAGQTSKDFVYKAKSGKLYHSRAVSESGNKIQFGETKECPKPSECEKIELKPKFRYLYPLTRKTRKEIGKFRKPYPKQLASS